MDGRDLVVRRDVEELLEALREAGRSAIEATVGNAYREAALKVEDLLNWPRAQTDDEAALPVRRDGRGHPAAAPSSDTPRLFVLDRHTDISGVSGTGIVAEGVIWSDGAVALRWLGSRPSTVHWDNLENVEWTHGHRGATTLRFLDQEIES